MIKPAPTSEQFKTALDVMDWLIEVQSFHGTVTLCEVYRSLLQNKKDAQDKEEVGSYLAAVQQADQQDTKNPHRPLGIDKHTEEGSPMFEFSKLQNDAYFLEREDNRVNYVMD